MCSSPVSWPSRAAKRRTRWTRASRAVRLDDGFDDGADEAFVVVALHAVPSTRRCTRRRSPDFVVVIEDRVIEVACLVGKWRKMMASVTPAAAAISLVVVPSKPLREKKSSAVSRSWRRRSLAGRRRVDVGCRTRPHCKSVLTYSQARGPFLLGSFGFVGFL